MWTFLSSPKSTCSAGGRWVSLVTRKGFVRAASLLLVFTIFCHCYHHCRHCHYLRTSVRQSVACRKAGLHKGSQINLHTVKKVAPSVRNSSAHHPSPKRPQGWFLMRRVARRSSASSSPASSSSAPKARPHFLSRCSMDPLTCKCGLEEAGLTPLVPPSAPALRVTAEIK